MKLIERKEYLYKMINVMGTPEIKVITGVRRSGKSTLLAAFKEYAEENAANVIYIDLNLLEFEKLKDYHALNNYIISSYKEGCENIVMIDEVQLCPNFELAVDSISASKRFDIYITGFSEFLSGSDLAALFTGRIFEIRVFPFSFKEFLLYYELDDKHKAFNRYLREGGIAGSYLFKNQDQKYDYIAAIFDSLILRDIKREYNIKNTALMKQIIDFLLSNLSNLTSERNIAMLLIPQEGKINHKTVGKYLDILCGMGVFFRLNRYDIHEKRVLQSGCKYFLGDHSFYYAKLGSRNADPNRIIKNIAAAELLRRGYEVYTGVLYKNEIDFVAIKRNEKIYIQTAYYISGEEALLNKAEPLLQIKDAYPKIILARTGEDYQYEGIRITDIDAWLAEGV